MLLFAQLIPRTAASGRGVQVGMDRAERATAAVRREGGRLARRAEVDASRRELSYTRRKRDAWAAEDLDRLPEQLRPRPDETLDLILRKRVLLLQARRGYRANTDSQLLALFAVRCAEKTPDALLDIGAANGLVSILLAKSFPAAKMHLIELQATLADRARRNLVLNGIAEARSFVLHADIARPLELPCRYDLVVSNPPYYPRDTWRVPPKGTEKQLAHLESSADLARFVCVMREALSESGYACFIQDFSEQERLVAAVESNGLCITHCAHVFHTSVDAEPLRVLLCARHAPRSGAERVPRPPPTRIELHPGDDAASVTYDGDHEAWLLALPRPPFIIGRLRPEYDHEADHPAARSNT